MEENNFLEHINKQMALNVHTAEVDDTLDHIVATYPYFIPARYIKAAKTHADKGYSSEMLTAIRPYLGNWLHFQEFLAGNASSSITRATATTNTQTPIVAETLENEDEVEVLAAKEEISPEEIKHTYTSEEEQASETTEIAVEVATTNATKASEQVVESEKIQQTVASNELELAINAEDVLVEVDVAEMAPSKDVIEEPSLTEVAITNVESIVEDLEEDLLVEIKHIEPAAFEEAIAEESETIANETITDATRTASEIVIEEEQPEEEATTTTPSDGITDFFAQIKLENRAVFEKNEDPSEENKASNQPHTYKEAIGLEAITLVKEESTVEAGEEENIDNSIIQVAIEMLSDDIDEQHEEYDELDGEVEKQSASTSHEEELEIVEDEPQQELEESLEIVEKKPQQEFEVLEILEVTEVSELEPFTAVEVITEATEAAPLETEATLEEAAAASETIGNEQSNAAQWPTDVAIELTTLPVEDTSEHELLQGLNKVLTKHNTKTHFSDTKQDYNDAMSNEPIFTHLATEDYFLQQGIKISNDLPADITEISPALAEQRLAEIILNDEHSSEEDKNKALMVMMSFTDWLMHFKNKKEENAATIEDKRHVKSMWQKEKLAAALEEEDDEIPEEVFEMAVNSITQEDDLASESLAEIYLQQGKHDKAIEMYKKLSLRNPEKNAYFALKIKDIIKEK